MGVFGKKKKDINESGYVQPIEALPVATLVSEATFPNMPPPSAPLSPSAGQNIVGGAGVSNTTYMPGTYNNKDYDHMISRVPMMMPECPSCHQESRTRVTTAPSWKTWAAGGCLFFVFWPLCWIPLVVDSCKSTEHHCVSCNSNVARVDAFEDCCVEHRE